MSNCINSNVRKIYVLTQVRLRAKRGNNVEVSGPTDARSHSRAPSMRVEGAIVAAATDTWLLVQQHVP